jgi:hypothetical protein
MRVPANQNVRNTAETCRSHFHLILIGKGALETEKPDIGSCANPNCNSEFKRLGEGRLFAFLVDDPAAWGLPEHAKQKAVWLCDECASRMHVRLDRRHHTIQIVREHGAQNSTAA